MKRRRDAVGMADRYEALTSDGDVELRDGIANALVRVSPSRGSIVSAFRVRERDVLASRGIPIMFPFPNRVPAGRYAWMGREHQLDLNEKGRPNHIHGLVRQQPWTMTALEATADGASVATAIDLATNDEVRRQYPFACALALRVKLGDGVLEHRMRVTNTGRTKLPFGYGLHPWFPARPRRDTLVRVPAARHWVLSDKIPIGDTRPVEGGLDLRDWRALGDRSYDDVFTDVARQPDGSMEAAVRYPADGVEIVVEASAAFREWVLYAPADEDVVCVEPYTCATNAINLQARGVDAGLATLAPGETWEATMRLRVRAT